MKIAQVIPLFKSGEKRFYKLQANIFITAILKQFWRDYITTDLTCSVIYSVQVSVGLELACQQLKLF